jgi:coenzyme F420-reducing hydrogenase delta subunit
MFVCTNCARPGAASTSSRRARPSVPDFGLPGRVDQIVIPCAGRIQPEHVLKALEAGSDVVAVVACEEGNCHYSEGSRRCALRVEHIGSLIEEIGLGEGRLVLAHLPGTAVEDMLLTAEPGSKIEPPDAAALDQKVGAVRDQVLEALRIVPANPLAAAQKPAAQKPAGKKVAKAKEEGGRR